MKNLLTIIIVLGVYGYIAIRIAAQPVEAQRPVSVQHIANAGREQVYRIEVPTDRMLCYVVTNGSSARATGAGISCVTTR